MGLVHNLFIYANYIFALFTPFSFIAGYAASMAVFFFSGRYIRELRREPFFLGILGFLGYGVLRALLSPRPDVGFQTMFGYLSSWLFPFLLGYGISGEKTARKLFWIFYSVFAGIVMLSVFAYFGLF
jgi:hypothetical protein